MLKYLKLVWVTLFADPNKALLEENARLRTKLRHRRKTVRDLNRALERWSMLARNGSLGRRLLELNHEKQIDAQRAKIDALTQELATERAKNGVQPTLP